MNAKVHKILIQMSKLAIYTFLIVQSILICFASRSDAQRKYLSEIEITLSDYSDANLGSLIKEIQKKSNFKFAYPNKSVKGRTVSIQGGDWPMDELLREISLQARLSIKRVNETIALMPVKGLKVLPDLRDNHLVQASVTGVVTDESGAPLPGATILEKGTTNGTITDATGSFRLDVSDGAVLQISFVGYVSKEIELGNQTSIEIGLEPDLENLEEVVVIGYGTARQKDIVGAVSSVKIEDSPIANLPSSNILQALRGGIAGINIGPQSNPGTTPSILVRGQNSINGVNDPLIVLDGIIFLGSINDINPGDISNIDILKDASAAAAYGSRSANGVIMITTKKGRTEKPVIRFSTSAGINTWKNKFDMMNLERYEQKYAAQQGWDDVNDIVFDDETRNVYLDQRVDTDFMDLISRNGFTQNHQVSVSGTTERTEYYFSGGFNSQEGPIIGDDFQRISVRSRLNVDVTKWLEIGLDGTYNNNDYSGLAASMRNAYMNAPIGYPYRYDGMPFNVNSATGTQLERYPTGGSVQNPLWGTDGTVEDIDKSNFFRFAGHALINVPKIEGLSYRLDYSINASFSIQDRFYFEDYYVGEAGPGNYIERYSDAALQTRLSQANGYNDRVNDHTYIINNILNYKKAINDHYIDATLVATRDYSYMKLVSLNGSDFSANGNTQLGVNGIHKAGVLTSNLDIIEKANVGYLARASYAFKDRYHVTASIRRDGSSVFGVDKKFGNFPSFGLAWTISEESFLNGSNYIDFLKLKASYGKNGNQGVEPYGTLARVNSGSDGGIRYEFGDNPSEILYGVQLSTLANPNLGWETTTSFNGGFQSALLGNRVFLDLDFYFSKTEDQIFLRQIPIMTGFEEIISSLGQVDNNGLEISLRTNNFSREDFKWSSGLIFWRNRNTLASLYGDDIDGDGVEDDDLSNNLFIGESLGAIYGYEFVGVVQATDTDYIAGTGAVPGDPMFNDLDGDGAITADLDRKILGFEKENFRLSFSNTLEYKNFSLYVLISGIFGGGKDNFYLKENPRQYSFEDRFDTNEIDHDWWTPENQSTEYLRPDYTGTRYLGLQSRSFVRIQDVSLSYNFPKGILGLSTLQLYASAKNFHTFTKWFGGGDPEAGITPGGQDEDGNDIYPVPTSYSFGLNVSF